MMVIAGVRFHQHNAQDNAGLQRTDTAALEAQR